MFLNIVTDKRTELAARDYSRKSKKRETEDLLRYLRIRPGWKVLVVWPGEAEELALLASLVGARGELVAVDSAGDFLARIETRKQAGAYQAVAPVSQPVHPAFAPHKKVDVPVRTAVFNGRSLDFPDNTFDALWCPALKADITAVAQEALTREFYRVVRPGGIIAFCRPEAV